MSQSELLHVRKIDDNRRAGSIDDGARREDEYCFARSNVRYATLQGEAIRIDDPGVASLREPERIECTACSALLHVVLHILCTRTRWLGRCE